MAVPEAPTKAGAAGSELRPEEAGVPRAMILRLAVGVEVESSTEQPALIGFRTRRKTRRPERGVVRIGRRTGAPSTSFTTEQKT